MGLGPGGHPDVRRMFLRREDVVAYVEAHTYRSDELRPS
jgi:hypothetical protein